MAAPYLTKSNQLLVVMACLLVVIRQVSCHSCTGSCDETTCEKPVGCKGGLVLDICGCCKICARVLNETCGGEYGLLGSCDVGLKCVITPKLGQPITGQEVGICREEKPPCNSPVTFRGCNIVGGKCECSSVESCGGQEPFAFEDMPSCRHALTLMSVVAVPKKEDCSKVKCDIVFQPDCPADSIVIESKVPIGECCPKAGGCKCDPRSCLKKVCPVDFEHVIVRNGSNIPGQCCDIHECKRIAVECKNVTCTEYVCPPDSAPDMSTADLFEGCCTRPRRCECLPERCRKGPNCPSSHVAKLTSSGTGKPGRCCDEYECIPKPNMTCKTSEGKIYSDGEQWQADLCTNCACKAGLIFCSMVNCVEPLCSRMVIPEGECCPHCTGCISASGETYNNSDIWKENDCVTCHCDEGTVRCQAEMCSVACENPIKRPGQCCPECTEPRFVTLPPHCPLLDDCKLLCEHGLVKKSDGCYVCECSLVDSTCMLNCEHGYETDRMGNLLCECAPACEPLDGCHKHCAHGFRTDRYGCVRCRCEKCGKFKCRKQCTYGYQVNDKGCPICKCTESSISIPTGKSIPVMPDTSVPISEKVCKTLWGDEYEDGESWHDGCRECYCHNGKEMCALITCPTPSCSSPLIRDKECCPSCPGDALILPMQNHTICHSVDGHYYVEGETWFLDDCTLCTCHLGHVLCEVQQCPPLLCDSRAVVTDKCCRTCPVSAYPKPSETNRPGESCITEKANLVEDGESWKPNPCQSCVCRDGLISCYSETCPSTAGCSRPVLRKGQCCPSCVDQLEFHTCKYKDLVYGPGERWNVDPCTFCSCVKGKVECTQKICSVYCTETFRMPGLCCPICKDPKSNYTGEEAYVTTETFELSTENPQDPKLEEQTNSRGALISCLVLVPILIAFVVALLILFIRRHKKKLKRGYPSSVYKASRPKSTNVELKGQFPDQKNGTFLLREPSTNNGEVCDYKKMNHDDQHKNCCTKPLV